MNLNKINKTKKGKKKRKRKTLGFTDRKRVLILDTELWPTKGKYDKLDSTEIQNVFSEN